jgi:hypothetical protein
MGGHSFPWLGKNSSPWYGSDKGIKDVIMQDLIKVLNRV